MICEKCRSENSENAKYCKACGAELNKITQKRNIAIGLFVVLLAIVLCVILIPILTSESKDINRIKNDIAISNLEKWAENPDSSTLINYLIINASAQANGIIAGTVLNSSNTYTIKGYVEAKFMSSTTVVGTASIFLPPSGLNPGESYKFEAESFDKKAAFDRVVYEEGTLYAD